MNHLATTNYAVDRTAQEPLLSIKAVASWLGVSRPTIYRLVDAGALHPVRVGERLRFYPADVRAYLDRGGDGESEETPGSRAKSGGATTLPTTPENAGAPT
jgi:excisionase family DNA binding protein